MKQQYPRTIFLLMMVAFGILISSASADDQSREGDTFALPKSARVSDSAGNEYLGETPPSVEAAPPLRVPAGSVLRLCEKGGKRVRYSNMAIAGYEYCGGLRVQRTCDPTGKRFIGAGEAPYAYLDCSRGQRIRIERSDGSPPVKESSVESMGADFAALEGQRKELDALLDGGPSGVKSRDHHMDKRAAKADDDPDGLPFNMRAIEVMLKSVKGRNSTLLKALQGDE